MLPGDRLICAFTESHGVGETFRDWYLHVTIVPWFRFATATEEIARDLERGLSQLSPFEVRMSGRDHFGRRRKPVTLVAEPTPLIEIESIVRRYFHRQQAWLVDETTKRHRSYRPHVTAQKSGDLQSGDSFMCSKLYVIEQHGGFKKIVGVIDFGTIKDART